MKIVITFHMSSGLFVIDFTFVYFTCIFNVKVGDLQLNGF